MNRSERRRQLKADSKLLMDGLDPINPDRDQLTALMRLLHEQLCTSRAEGSVNSMMAFLYENMGLSTRRLRQVPIACLKGCSHCCHTWVSASAPEVLFVRNTISPKSRERVRESILQAHRATGGKSPDERFRMATACPLLNERLCSVYAHRPIVCRTAVSLDANVCERSYVHFSGEAIPSPAWYSTVREGYDVALSGAIRREGLAYASYEFNAALKVVFENSDAERQWLSGEDIFSGLAQNQREDPFQSGAYRQIYESAFS
jgi:Fe-S-cluster containining protein